MMSLLIFTALAAIAYSSTGWDRLETTWAITPWSGFFDIPTTFMDASTNGWELLMVCGDIGAPGNVFWKPGDYTRLPFYDYDGKIAGIILGVSDPGASSHTDPFIQYFTRDGSKTFWGIEANFRDPKKICLYQGTTDDLIGDRFWFRQQDGSYDEVPLTQDASALSSKGWVQGSCFFKMGDHYWRYISKDQSCEQTYPVFLLYNNQKLVGWGIALSHSDRPDDSYYNQYWEHPEGNVIKAFFQEETLPTCLLTAGKLATVHVFMTNPLWSNCLFDDDKKTNAGVIDKHTNADWVWISNDAMEVSSFTFGDYSIFTCIAFIIICGGILYCRPNSNVKYVAVPDQPDAYGTFSKV